MSSSTRRAKATPTAARSRAQLRWLLTQVLPGAADLEQLVIDHLDPEQPGFFAEYSGQRGRVEQTSLILLRWQGREDVLLQYLHQLRPDLLARALTELPAAPAPGPRRPLIPRGRRARLLMVGGATLLALGALFWSHGSRPDADHHELRKPDRELSFPAAPSPAAVPPAAAPSLDKAPTKVPLPRANQGKHRVKVSIQTYDDCDVEFAGQRKQPVDHEAVSFDTFLFPGRYTVACICGEKQKHLTVEIRRERIEYGPEKCFPDF